MEIWGNSVTSTKCSKDRASEASVEGALRKPLCLEGRPLGEWWEGRTGGEGKWIGRTRLATGRILTFILCDIGDSGSFQVEE